MGHFGLHITSTPLFFLKAKPYDNFYFMWYSLYKVLARIMPYRQINVFSYIALNYASGIVNFLVPFSSSMIISSKYRTKYEIIEF